MVISKTQKLDSVNFNLVQNFQSYQRTYCQSNIWVTLSKIEIPLLSKITPGF